MIQSEISLGSGFKERVHLEGCHSNLISRNIHTHHNTAIPIAERLTARAIQCRYQIFGRTIEQTLICTLHNLSRQQGQNLRWNQVLKYHFQAEYTY